MDDNPLLFAVQRAREEPEQRRLRPTIRSRCRVRELLRRYMLFRMTRARISDGTDAAMPVDMVTGHFTGFDLALNQDVIDGAAG